jgi:hypothetical protein
MQVQQVSNKHREAERQSEKGDKDIIRKEEERQMER